MRLALVLALLAPAQEVDLDVLLRRLADDSIEAREKAAAALIARGKQAAAAIEKALPGLSGEQKALASEVLKRIQTDLLLHQSLPPLQRFSVSAQDRPLLEVLADLCRKAELKLTCDEDGLRDKRVSVELKDATLLEALEAVATASKTSYAFPPGGVVFVAERENPIAVRLVRHYRLSLDDVEVVRRLRPDSNSATLRFNLRTIPGVKGSLNLDFYLTAIEDDKGRSLLPANLNPTHGTFIDFNCPAEDARRLSVIRGRVVTTYPGEIRTLSFPMNPPKEGQVRELEGIRVELLRAERKDSNFTVTVRSFEPKDTRNEIERHWIRLRLKDGSYAPSNGGSSRGSSDPKVGSLDETRFQPGGEPEAFELEYLMNKFQDSFEFELKDIPLPR